ncbi:CDP-diacylglycerol--glycerol-3-phosphate 3-phosphatidyltransferase [Haliovirga abyssi]|uniref:CDP-diacylglycerol--glycerol-3-phosphate 3-phosphatidyltransferase n=1 Tax=Haliovirga abyssi TaxID=2996794 RepID=A0AAU9D9L5_9FUSO|nr:CDP-diacylglycerol--glycerol-3-phosphate 3-phosphatidyltransferase [Haliovirga abyssi]BDU49990.1 CDP-diacylglycerol--glycerol-3-phosphate 3-phosphatidyltransferase [Haliovirga abyssi]
MNLPNKLTLLRIVLIVPFLIFLELDMPIAAVLIFAIASITDFFDGYIARKDNLITKFGKLMDPLADKILVLSALTVFVELHYIPSWMVIIIFTREFLVTGLRILAASDGVVIAAAKIGKYKTASQMIVIIIVIFTKNSIISQLLMLIPVVLTIWSGYDYVIKGKKYFLDD